MGFAGRAFSGLWVAGIVLGAAILAAVFAGYWFFITEQRQYIVGRDFRLLSTLARQIDGTVESETRVITNLADDAAVKGQATTALAERWVKLRGRPYQAADIQFEKRAVDKMTTGYAFRTDGQLTLEVPLRPRGSAPEGHVARLKLQPGLESMFRSRVSQGAFDAILLGTQDGKVLLSAGATAQQIRSSGLGVLSSKPVDGGKAMTFPELAKSITMAEVSLAGVDYALFVFPCCLSSGKDSPLVLTGLVHAETLRSGSWAIPTTLVKVAVLGLLIAMVAWPFLKLILLGDRQQVRVSDFFQLGAASVAGLAIITILLLDSTAYLRLNRDMDAQLKDLADDLDAHATAEIRDAYAQLVCLERKTKSREVTEFDDGKLSSVLQDERLICDPWSPPASAVFRQAGADTRLSSDPELRWPYPFMDTVAFSDRVGMQQVKLGASRSVSNRIPVGERDSFSSVVNGRGWRKTDFCKDEKCALESIWSWTTGEARAVLAKESSLQWGAGENLKFLPVAAISIPMRSLIGPILPPGFTFAVIDHSGKVLFHSDSQRNGSEDLFVETDNNRRLRAQIAAHSAEPLNIRYWGSEYRAYLKPMSLPDMYVVAMAQKERTWAINREWLVVTLIFVTIYLVLWLIVALATLGRNASWVWPDAARQNGYVSVSGFCAVLLIVALMTAWYYDRNYLLVMGILLPLSGWIGAYLFLRHRPKKGSVGRREPLGAYSVAAALLLLVTGVVPGALLFLASYQLHARSYIKNSQLIVARRLSERFDRVNEEYLSTDDGKLKQRKPAATQVGLLYDLDLYTTFLYNTSIKMMPAMPPDSDLVQTTRSEAATPAPSTMDHDSDMVLSFLEDYLPYYSEASVEWRELLHDRADDGSWESMNGQKGSGDVKSVFMSRAGSLPVELTSSVPSITHVPPAGSARRDPRAESGTRDSSLLLLCGGMALLALTWGVVQILNRRIYLVGITEPLWAGGQLAVNAGENVLVLCDKTAKENQIAGITPLKLGPIVQERDVTGAWRRALFALDERSGDSAVLIDDFDEGLDDARAMDHKLTLLEELVSDQSRTVILLSQVSLRGLTDSLRHSSRVIAASRQTRASGQKATSPEPGETPFDRWKRIVKAFVVIERREQAPAPLEAVRSSPAASEPPLPPRPFVSPAASRTLSWSDRFDEFRSGPVVAFLTSEGRSHPYVNRICEDLRRSIVVRNGDLTRRQAFDEVAERTAQFYRGLWASCSEDEKVVLGHIAQHGLANASVRSVVRRLLGRRLLCKDPALRPMNETFRRFILSRECSKQVAALETESGPSAWDRLRAPLGVAVVGVAVFLFATQKELYNAILGVTTAAAVSVPTLIRAVGMLVGRRVEGTGTKV